MIFVDSRIVRQFGRFAAVGAVGTAFHYIVLLMLVEQVGAGVVLSSSAGALAGCIVNYLLNYHFTFASTKAHIIAAPSFFLIAAAGLALNGILMHIFVQVMSVHYVLAQVATTGIVLCWNFGLNRSFTFRK